MLAMLECSIAPKISPPRRLIRKLVRDDGLFVRRITVLGAPVLHIIVNIEQYMKPRTLEKRLLHVSRVMRFEGVSSVCFTTGFPYTGFFLNNGFDEPDLTRLYETLACKAVRFLPCEGKMAYFAAGRLSSAAYDTLLALCGRFRHVLADISSGGGEFFGDIRRRLGISVVENPVQSQIYNADAAVLFSSGNRRETMLVSDKCIVFAVNTDALSGVCCKRLVTDVDIALPHEKEAELSDGFPRAALIANALNLLSLTPDALTLNAMTATDGTVFQLDKATFV